MYLPTLYYTPTLLPNLSLPLSDFREYFHKYEVKRPQLPGKSQTLNPLLI